jgi:hypothetical protein
MPRRGSRPHRGVLLAGVPAVAGAGGWQQAGEPFHGAGLLGAVVLAVTVLPPLLLILVTAPGALVKAAVPRRVRIWWRKPMRFLWWHRDPKHPDCPERLRLCVLAADRWRCVWCGERNVRLLQADHIVPHAGGGLLTLFNLITLCRECNFVKCNYNVDGDGYVHYRRNSLLVGEKRSTAELKEAARLILAREQEVRWRPLRWWRAALAY